MKIKCLQCGYEFELESASNDELGWHTICPECEGSFDIDIKDYLVPNGTKVFYGAGQRGIIDGNDADNSEEFDDINYYICPIEHINKDVWSDNYIMLRREEFSL